MLVTQHSDGSYAALAMETESSGYGAVLNVHYDLLFDVDPTHRGLVVYNNGPIAITHVIGPSARTLEVRTGEQSLWKSFTDYVREGVWHIWIGFDHILFLLALLLPAVLIRREQSWMPVEPFWPVCMSVLKVVTMFTLAHSITLWLALMEYVTLPAQFVEATIAFSIVVTALNNLYPVLGISSCSIAFGFGLVHGFGFANVLLDLGLSSVTLALSLFGFNVGVELGQIAIVLIFLPFAFCLRNTTFYRRAIFCGGSMLVSIIAGLWMYERIFNVEIFAIEGRIFGA